MRALHRAPGAARLVLAPPCDVAVEPLRGSESQPWKGS
jgi:hypothetical protein